MSTALSKTTLIKNTDSGHYSLCVAERFNPEIESEDLTYEVVNNETGVCEARTCSYYVARMLLRDCDERYKKIQEDGLPDRTDYLAMLDASGSTSESTH